MKRLIILLAIPLLLQSCSSMYIPAVRSIPLLEKKGEFQGEAGVSTNSVYLNGSYAFTNDIAASINGNMSYRNFTDYYDVFTHKNDTYNGGGFFDMPDFRGKFAHRYGEISVGKINMLPSRTPKLEMFGGAGMGRATDTEIDFPENQSYYISSFTSDYKCNYYSFFGQVNLGLKKRVVETGVSMRFAYSIFNYNADLYNQSEVFSYQNTFNVFHVEPMGFTRIGSENLKVVFRYGIHLALTIPPIEEDTGLRGFDDYGRLDYTIFHFSVGLSYRIAGK